MARRHPNHRLVKIHRSYTVEEVSTLLGVHRNTVREWIKRGLAMCDHRRPRLILGHELVRFLQGRRLKNKRTCKPGELYCVRCREPRFPAGDMVDYEPATDGLGNLVGICPICECLINRRVNRTKLALVRGNLNITFRLGVRRLGETTQPSLNSDFGEDASTDGHAQSEE